MRLPVLVFLAFSFSWPALQRPTNSSTTTCQEFGFAGRVNGGEEYSHRLGGRLWLRLLPFNDKWGWIIQLHPEGGNDDYAFPLNPPYHGDNRQWLATGYGDTAEYRLKYEHEVFFSATQAEYERNGNLYEQYLDHPGNRDTSAAGKFLAMLPSLRSSLLRLKPEKYETTDEGKSVSWMEFSVKITVPKTFEPAPDLKATSAPCAPGEL